MVNTSSGTSIHFKTYKFGQKFPRPKPFFIFNLLDGKYNETDSGILALLCQS